MTEFIFMLTRNDVTIEDAAEVYARVRNTGVASIGCKDIGLDSDHLRALIHQIQGDGHRAYLEVVSETVTATMKSARVAAQTRPDFLIGGNYIEPVRKILDGTGVSYYPYVGEIVGHPCSLHGSIPDICADVRRAEELGVDGINLLAYRYDGDVEDLVRAVREATSLPIICAGNVASIDQIRTLRKLGITAFTVGTAVLDKRFIPGAPIKTQIEAILEAAA